MAQKKIEFLQRQRSFLRSAIQLQDNKRKIQEMKRNLQGLYEMIPTSKKILTLSPAPNNLGDQNQLTKYYKRKRPIRSAYASLRNSKQFDGFSPSRSQNDSTMKSCSLTMNQTSKIKSLALDPEGITDAILARKINRGMFGSVVKNKNQKKGKWIEMKNKITNISRVYQISNSNLRGDIGKIINLISEQNRIEHNQTNFH